MEGVSKNAECSEAQTLQSIGQMCSKGQKRMRKGLRECTSGVFFKSIEWQKSPLAGKLRAKKATVDTIQAQPQGLLFGRMQQASLQTPRTFSGGKNANRLTGGMTPRTAQTPRTGNLGTGGQTKTPKTKATPGTGAGSSGRQVGETYIMAITENKRRQVRVFHTIDTMWIRQQRISAQLSLWPYLWSSGGERFRNPYYTFLGPEVLVFDKRKHFSSN
jgi:hypothetical protein